MRREVVVVVGGGITGLTAAWRLARAGVDVRLLERASRTGGIVATHRPEGRVLEAGPDCFLATKPWALELARELELEREVQGTSPRFRRSFVLRSGRLEAIPEGFHLIAPTRLDTFFASPILSRRGKARALLDLALPRRGGGDESLASFVRRRLGGELFSRLAEPLVAGIYTADPERLSLRATMPQFLDMEAEHGSVIRALRARRDAGQEIGASGASGARYGLFLTFERGQASLTDALAARLGEIVEVESDVRRVRPVPGGFEVEVGSRVLPAAAVVLAVPAPVAARLLEGEAGRLLGTIPYASAVTVNLLYGREQVGHPLDGMGFVIPAREKKFALACTFSSTKFSGRVGGQEVLLRAFVGGALHPERVELSDAEIQARVLEDLGPLLDLEGAPRLVTIHRHPGAMPQYLVGHLERVAAIEDAVRRVPGLAVAGNALRGVGIPDCVRSANDAARQILAYLGRP